MHGQASFITLTSKIPCLCTQLNAMECSRLVETSAFTLINRICCGLLTSVVLQHKVQQDKDLTCLVRVFLMPFAVKY